MLCSFDRQKPQPVCILDGTTDIWEIAHHFKIVIVFILSEISPYTTGLKVLFNLTYPTAQVQPQLTSN